MTSTQDPTAFGFGRLFWRIRDAVIVASATSGEITLWNPAAEAMFGYTAAEAVGQRFTMLFPQAAQAANAAGLTGLSALEAESLLTSLPLQELPARRKDGSEIVVEVSVSPMELESDPGTRYFMALVREATQRVEALRRAQQQADLLELAHDAILVLEPVTSRILYWNPGAERLYGWTAAEATGRISHELFATRFPLPLEAIQEALWRDSHWEGEVRHTTASGREVLVASRWALERDASGAPSRVMEINRDVTQQREVERLKNEFVSTVSHELRTPLTSIKGYVDLLLDGEVGDISHQQHEFLEIVKHNADRLVGLVNDLLDLSRIESGRIEMHRDLLDLAEVIRRAATALRPQFASKQQRLRVDVRAPVLVDGDADRLAQVMTNLLSNAHKYTPEKGEIDITVHRVDGAWQVAVRDTGIGLAQEDLAQLFTPFFRARNRTAQMVGGTGLGLAITRQILERLGGRIEVESALGTGSTFRFTLPVAGSTPDGSEAAAPAAATADEADKPTLAPLPPSRAARVLVVEDEPDIASLIQRYLERAGHSVRVAHDGPSALRIATLEPPDLITLDVLLPGADGYTVLEWLKSQPETAGVPVLLLSIVPDTGRATALGAAGHLDKPVSEAALLRHVGEALAQVGRALEAARETPPDQPPAPKS